VEGVLYFADTIRKALFEDYWIYSLCALFILLAIDYRFVKVGYLFPKVLRHFQKSNDEINDGSTQNNFFSRFWTKLRLKPEDNLAIKNPLLKSFRRFRAKRVALIVWVAACSLLLPYNLLEAKHWIDWLFPIGITICWIYLTIQFVSKDKVLLRLFLLALPVLVFLFCFIFNVFKLSSWTLSVWVFVILLFLAGLYLVLDACFFSNKDKNLRVFCKPYAHPIESLHLLLPKLIASITAAWLTIAMGFDALAAFFDSSVYWSTMSIIIIVVFCFILYQIDRGLPQSSSWLKVFRSFEMLIISYSLSLCIGVIIINFIGGRYLERSGALNDYYDEYVCEQGKAPIIVNINSEDTLISISKDESIAYPTFETARERLKLLRQKYTKLKVAHDTILLSSPYPGNPEVVITNHKLVDEEPVYVRKEILYSKRGLFIIQDFLVMFSFVAMFIGVFLQMVFFDRKKMTEF